MADTVHFQALRRVAGIYGNEEVARRLNVPLETLEAWLCGHATMPARKFIVVIDLLSEADATPG